MKTRDLPLSSNNNTDSSSGNRRTQIKTWSSSVVLVGKRTFGFGLELCQN